ncbi:hypothetical protein WMF30_50150 [Sorangium sp. So ce134]
MDDDAGIASMLVITELVVREFEGEALSSFKHEDAALVRASGELTIDDIHELSTAERSEVFASVQQR